MLKFGVTEEEVLEALGEHYQGRGAVGGGFDGGGYWGFGVRVSTALIRSVWNLNYNKFARGKLTA